MSDELEKPVPSKSEAVEFTGRFKRAFDTFCDSAEEVAKFLKESLEIDYWRGFEGDYDSWKEWYETEYEDQIEFLRGVKLGIDTRADIVESLASGGLSNREIASTIGVGEATVRRDLRKITLGASDDASNEVDNEETAGQSVAPVGHIDEHSASSPNVPDDEPPVVTMSQEFNQPNNGPETDRFGGINFDAMIIPVPKQIIEAEPSDQTPEFFTPRVSQPSWSPPQVAPLGPPPSTAYDVPEPEFLEPALTLPKPQETNKDDSKHCKTCNCNLLP